MDPDPRAILIDAGLISGAFLTALLGSAHCAGMCGGIVSALSLSGRERRGMVFHALYHLGRATTYVAIGTVIAWMALGVTEAKGLHRLTRWLLLGADVFVIFVGLAALLGSRAGGFGSSGVLAPGSFVLRASTKLRSMPGAVVAFPLGLVLGLLPCGFLYAVALNAGLTARPIQAAAMMAAFALGTTPSLVAFAGFAELLRSKGSAWMLRGAGAAVAALGALNLVRHAQRFGLLEL